MHPPIGISFRQRLRRRRPLNQKPCPGSREKADAKRHHPRWLMFRPMTPFGEDRPGRIKPRNREYHRKPNIDLAERGREAAVTVLNALLPIDLFTPFVNGATKS